MKYLLLSAALLCSPAQAGNFESVWVPDDIVVDTPKGWVSYCTQYPAADQCDGDSGHNPPPVCKKDCTPPPTCEEQGNCEPPVDEDMSKAEVLRLLAGVDTYRELPTDTPEQKAFKKRVYREWVATGKKAGIKTGWKPFYDRETATP